MGTEHRQVAAATLTFTDGSTLSFSTEPVVARYVSRDVFKFPSGELERTEHDLHWSVPAPELE